MSGYSYMILYIFIKGNKNIWNSVALLMRSKVHRLTHFSDISCVFVQE